MCKYVVISKEKFMCGSDLVLRILFCFLQAESGKFLFFFVCAYFGSCYEGVWAGRPIFVGLVCNSDCVRARSYGLFLDLRHSFASKESKEGSWV